MLGMLLTILKIILIVIGIILGIILSLIAILLFAGFFYEASGAGNMEESMDLNANFKWLFGIVKGSFIISKDGISYSVVGPFGVKFAESDSESLDLELDENNILNSDEIDNKGIANIEKNSKIDNIKKKIKELYIKIKDLVTIIKEKIEFVQDFNTKYNIKSLIKATIKLVIRLIKNLGFKKLEIIGTIGFDDPAQTGKALGAIGIASAYLPGNIDIRGNFDEKELTLSFDLRGRTSIFKLLFPVAVYVFTRPVRPVAMDYWKGEFNGRL